MLKDRLNAVALMMEQSQQYAALEIAVWRCLVEQVDYERFERTGQIIAANLTTPLLSASTLPHLGHVAAADIEAALASLADKHHIVPLERAGRKGLQLFLFAPDRVPQDT